MDGIQMLTQRLLMAMGVKPEDLKALEEEIPKLRQNIPAFAAAINAKVEAIESGVLRLETKVDTLMMAMDQLADLFSGHITSQELPPGPETVKSLPAAVPPGLSATVIPAESKDDSHAKGSGKSK